ncbi:MAG: hypothetical protein LBE13_11485 [Bacteroidales bacterium]|jgi:hypothetical protein|nr:hypothetical protein [Bacteroidales bacterium]
MTKTDDIIKLELTSIGHYKTLKMRGFVGSSNYDQELWVNGGLTFRYNEKSYGSNDFAWYKEEKWVEPGTGIACDAKPVIVIECTDCLNTRSYGTAQIQRFHRAYGPFMNGNMICIYYLKEGEYAVRNDLSLAVYYANLVEKYKERKCAYLITSQLSDIKKLVHLIGNHGECSEEVWEFVDSILTQMKQHFENHFKGKYGSYEDYLNKHYIFKCPDGNWIKYIGAKERSFTDSSIRYGHIVLGEAFVAHYLLAGKELIGQGKKIKYYFPLINNTELQTMRSTLTRDKEFAILNDITYWDVITYDQVVFDDQQIKMDILPFRTADLNKQRKVWNVVRDKIENAFKKGKFKIISSVDYCFNLSDI